MFQTEGKMQLQLDEDEIVWPGGSRSKPTGLMIPTHLKVLTILEQPFVYARKLGSKDAVNAVGGGGKKAAEKAKVNWGDFADVLSGDGGDDDDDGYGGGGGGGGSGQGANKNGGKGGGGGGDELPENSCDLARGEIPCPIYDKRMAADGKESLVMSCAKCFNVITLLFFIILWRGLLRPLEPVRTAYRLSICLSVLSQLFCAPPRTTICYVWLAQTLRSCFLYFRKFTYS